MNNERGSILVITLAFILIFSLLGFASLQLAGRENEAAQKELNRLEAFWLADGMLDLAKAQVKATAEQFSNLNEKTRRHYIVTVDPVTEEPLGPNEKLWEIRSTGTIYDQSKTLIARVLQVDTQQIINQIDDKDKYAAKATFNQDENCISIQIDGTLPEGISHVIDPVLGQTPSQDCPQPEGAIPFDIQLGVLSTSGPPQAGPCLSGSCLVIDPGKDNDLLVLNSQQEGTPVENPDAEANLQGPYGEAKVNFITQETSVTENVVTVPGKPKIISFEER